MAATLKKLSFRDFINDILTVFLVSNNNNAKREYDLLTEISDMIKYYIDNMNTEQTIEKKIEFDNNW